MKTPWRLASAVVIGSDHRRVSSPCQDAAMARRLLAPDGERLLLVACDGAGSARYGEVGARVACETASRFLAGLPPNSLKIETMALGERLLHTVQTTIASRALTLGATTRDLSTTLLAAVVCPDRAVFFQVGDGAIVIGRGDTHEVVFWPAKGEHANETSFVTSADAASRLEVVAFDDPNTPIDELALITDGLERLALDFSTKTAFSAFFAPMFAAVRDLPTTHPELVIAEAHLSLELDAFLDSPRVNDATGDDKTLILATRRADATT